MLEGEKQACPQLPQEYATAEVFGVSGAVGVTNPAIRGATVIAVTAVFYGYL